MWASEIIVKNERSFDRIGEISYMTNTMLKAFSSNPLQMSRTDAVASFRDCNRPRADCSDFTQMTPTGMVRIDRSFRQ